MRTSGTRYIALHSKAANSTWLILWKYRFYFAIKLMETQLAAHHLHSALMENGWENVWVGKCQRSLRQHQAKTLAFFAKPSLFTGGSGVMAEM